MSLFDGLEVGGDEVGEKDTDGSIEGDLDGNWVVGTKLGISVGFREGDKVGVDVVGFEDGRGVVGKADGTGSVGAKVGFELVGNCVGKRVGWIVGYPVGFKVGCEVDGFDVGLEVDGAGETVGATVLFSRRPKKLISRSYAQKIPSAITRRTTIVHKQHDIFKRKRNQNGPSG